MSNAFASALEISAKIVRENYGDPVKAHLLISERLTNIDLSETSRSEGNVHLADMQEGYRAVLCGLKNIAPRVPISDAADRKCERLVSPISGE